MKTPLQKLIEELQVRGASEWVVEVAEGYVDREKKSITNAYNEGVKNFNGHTLDRSANQYYKEKYENQD